MAKKKVTQNSEGVLADPENQEAPVARKVRRKKADAEVPAESEPGKDAADGTENGENQAPERGDAAGADTAQTDADTAQADADTAQAEALFNMIMEEKARYAGLQPEEQQYLLYNMLNERLYWRIIYYMRRFPERLTSSGPTYSDRCIGGEELMTMMGFNPPEMFANQWLDHHRVPPRDIAAQQILVLDAQVNAYLDVESACPIASIQRHFALSNDELEILATLVAAMSENSLLRLMTVAWADYSVKLPTVSFVAEVLGDTPEREALVTRLLSESGTLRKMRLVLAEKHAAFPNYTPLAHTPLSVEQVVIDAYRGTADGRDMPPNMALHQTALARGMVIARPETFEEMAYLLKPARARLCCVGPIHAGRRTMLLSMVIQELHRRVLEVDACREFERIPANEIDSRLAEIMREALLSGCALMLRFDALEDNSELLQRLVERQTQIARLVSFYPGEILLLATKPLPFFDDAFEKPAYIHVPLPTVEVAATAWARALSPWCAKEACERMAEVFSRNYSLPVGGIFGVVKDAAETVQGASDGTVELQSHHILNEIRKSFRHQLGSLAEITVSDVPLSGVVLPPEAKAQVNEILEYAKNLHNVLDIWGFRQRSPYGNALSVLFAGPPGTGKTLLACALANELGKVLYRVDLSRIVDKYIGETEKNLGRIFDEAAKAQAIILFDEADSLFAKRTEVKSSNDRYANLEINFLLQKLESYNGITILTTNLSKSIDEAFRRRLRFIIDFPMPDVSARVALWKRMMPPGAPLSDDIRWQWLARTFEMSGGYIRNAVLKASIAASAAKMPISMEHLAKAAADEARSMGTLMRIDEDYEYYDDDDDFN